MLDWSRARDVKPDRETHVRLYDQGASDPIKSRFLSATEDLLTLQHEDGQAGTGGVVHGIRGIIAWIGPSACNQRWKVAPVQNILAGRPEMSPVTRNAW